MRRFVQAFSGHALGQPPEVEDGPELYNIGKGDTAWVIVVEDGAPAWRAMRWGLVPSWSKTEDVPYTTVTARLERAPASRIFASAWKSRHCLVPMTGYYKWDRSVKPAVPHFIHAADGDTLYTAGLWAHREADDATLLSFAILTHANDAIPPPLTPDGPIFLPEPARLPWLDGSLPSPQARLRAMPQPALASYAVSPAHRDRSRDDYTLLEPLSASDDLAVMASRHDEDEDDDDA